MTVASEVTPKTNNNTFMHLSETTIQIFTIPKLACYLLWDSKISVLVMLTNLNLIDLRQEGTN